MSQRSYRILIWVTFNASQFESLFNDLHKFTKMLKYNA